MEGYHGYQGAGGATNNPPAGENPWNTQPHSQSQNGGYEGHIEVNQQPPSQYYNPDASACANNAFQNYTQQQQQYHQVSNQQSANYQQTNQQTPNYQQTDQQLYQHQNSDPTGYQGGAVGGAYNWPDQYQHQQQQGGAVQQQQQFDSYPPHYDDPNSGQWTGNADHYFNNEGLGMGSPPDLFSAGNSLDSSLANAEFHTMPANHQPDMVPHSVSNQLEQHSAQSHDTENLANQPPDMLPMTGQAVANQLEDRMLGVELEGASASGPDIISNGVRGDEKTRPDILSPAREDTDGAVGGGESRSSSAVLHSPTGAFEPVRGASRSASLTETDPTLHHPQNTGTTAPPLWEQPTLPNVQLQPPAPAVTLAAPVPVQVLPTQVLQSMGAESMVPTATSSNIDLSDDLVPGIENLTLSERVAEHPTSHPDVQISLADSHSSANPSTATTDLESPAAPPSSIDSTGAPPTSGPAPPISGPAPPSSIEAAPTSMDAPVTSVQVPPTSLQTMPSLDSTQPGPISSVPHSYTAESSTVSSTSLPQQNFVPIQTASGSLPSQPQQQQQPGYGNAASFFQPAQNVPGQQHSLGQMMPNNTGGVQQQAVMEQALPSHNSQASGMVHQAQTNTTSSTSTQPTGVMGQPSMTPQGQMPPGNVKASTASSQPQPTQPGQVNSVQGVPATSAATSVTQSSMQQPMNFQGQPMMSPGQGMYPNNQMMPNQQGMMPNQQGMMPNQQGMMGNQTMNNQNQFMNPGMMPNMNYGMNMMGGGPYGMMGNGMQGMMGNGMPGMMGNMPYMQQQGMYPPGMMMGNQGQMYPQQGQPYGNQRQQFSQMDPQMQQRMSMMKGFKPLHQQQLSGQQGSAYAPRTGLSQHGSTTPVRGSGPMVGQHPQHGYGRHQRSQPNSGYGQYDRGMHRNHSFGSYRDESFNSYREEEYGYGRPRSREVYEERRGYGYGSRPSSRSGSRPSSRTGSAAPGMFNSEVNPYLNQSGFSPRPPSRTSSRLDSAYQHSQVEDSSSGDSDDDSTPGEPPRMTPAKFPLPHVIPRLLHNGDSLEVQPNQPDEGQPATICILRRHLYQPSLVKFPGPLIKGQTHKRDVLDYCNKMALAARDDSSLIDRGSTELLWNFLHLMVKQNGTYIGSDIAELLLEGYDVDGSLYAVRCGTKANANMTQQETVDRFRQLVMFGNTKEALDWAMSSDLWGHALFLSSKMSSRIHAQVLTRFANTSMTPHDPLQTLYQLMSNRQPSAATHPDDGWGTWRPHLAMMLCNPSSETQLNMRSITALGDSLAAKGLLHASQFCYLMADLPLEPYTKKSAKLSLIGVQSGVSIEEYTQESATELTEIYEYAKSLAGDSTVIPHLQICKFYHARNLLDKGQPTEALAYLEAIANKVTDNTHLFCYPFIAQLYTLSERLKYFDAEAAYVREGRTLEVEWITKLGQSLERRNAELLSGYTPQMYVQPQSESGDTEDMMATSLPSTHTQPVEDPLVSQQSSSTTVPDLADYHYPTNAQSGYGYQAAPPQESARYGYQAAASHDQNKQEQSWQGQGQAAQSDTTQGYSQPTQQAPYSTQLAPPPTQQTSQWPAQPQLLQYTMQAPPQPTYTAGPPASNSQPPLVADHTDGETSSQHSPGSDPSDYFDYKPEAMNARPSVPTSTFSPSSSGHYGSGSIGRASYGTAPNSSTFGAPPTSSGAPQIPTGGGRRLSSSFPDNANQLKSGGGTAAPPSRSLSNSGTNRSLAELIKEKREIERMNSQSNKPQENHRYMPSSVPQEPNISRSTDGPAEDDSKEQKPSSKSAGNKSGGGFGFGFGSFFSRMLPKGKNEIKLPDDSKQTIVWDDKLKKWVDTESDGTEEVKAAPPPTDMTLGRPSPSQQMDSRGPPTSTTPTDNVYSLKRSGKAKYVDVMGKKAGTSLTPIPQHLFDVTPRSSPTSNIFTPTPTTDTDTDADIPPSDSNGEMSQPNNVQQQYQSQYGVQQQYQHQQQQYNQQSADAQLDSQMPRNISMASLEVQNIMTAPPLPGQPPQPAAPTTSQAPPTTQPTASDTSQQDSSSSAPAMPPMMFNPAQFKAPVPPPGGRPSGISSRSRYPK